MKRLLNIGIIILLIILPILIFICNIKLDCIFKTLTGIACPGCGLTRSIKELLNFNIIKSLNYNILGIPLVILTITSVIMLIFDTIKNSNDYLTKIICLLKKHYLSVIFILIFTMIINNINGI